MKTATGFFLPALRTAGLTPVLRRPIPSLSAGRTAAPRQGRKAGGEESPGSMDKRCRITSGGGKPARAGSTPGKVPQRTDRRGA